MKHAVFSCKRMVSSLIACLLICVFLVSCAKAPKIDPEWEVRPEPLERSAFSPTSASVPEPENPDKLKINYVGVSSCFAGWSRYPRYTCAMCDYVIVARVTGYLGGVDLAWNNHQTLLEVENLESMMGDLMLGKIPVRKRVGINWTNYCCSTSSGDYCPEPGSYWILLLKAKEDGALEIDGIVDHGMIPLEIEYTDDTAALLAGIHETSVYQEYLAGARDHEYPAEVDPSTVTHNTSPFENGSENAADREKLFVPDWTRDDLYDLLPHKPAEQPKRQPSDYSSDEVVSMTVYPDDTIVYH